MTDCFIFRTAGVLPFGLFAALTCFAAVLSGCGAGWNGSTSGSSSPTPYPSIRAFGVLPTNSPEQNRDRLQAAIDWASARGAALFVEPGDEPYPVAGGLVLRQNASLIGVHGPVGRGTKHPTKPQPVGSVFSITDREKPFITVEGATQLRGLQFWYPEQTIDAPDQVIAYPPTIQVSRTKSAQGVTLSCLTFYGEYMALDFRADPARACEQILFEHCYGYPLSGRFIAIDFCYDVPRILHCHVNPANLRYFRGGYDKVVIDSTIARKTFTYWIDHTDNAVCMDLFTFGTHGGIYLGPDTYGQLTNFNFDCVTVGIHKLGSNAFNRNWQIAQGSIIANTGAPVNDIHPIVVEGHGHTAITNVEAFSGPNAVVSGPARSWDYLRVEGDTPLTISLFGCRMRNYESENPITNTNPQAIIRAVGCIDKNEQPFECSIAPAPDANRPNTPETR